MALIESTMLPLNTHAPDFTLLDTVTQKSITLSQQVPAKATVIMFICNHCPYVKRILPKLVEVTHHYQLQEVRFYAISSNDVKTHEADSPENMAELAQQQGFSFPYLYDETQTVAKQYQAACTPDFYVFDDHLKLVYRGRFDASTPGNGMPITGDDLCQALDAVLTGAPVAATQYPSMGCSIKWK